MGRTWTADQLQAIKARECDLLVAAGAGSGKTAVLVERIIQIISDRENPVDLDRLLVVTFTKAAATEMRERIAQAITKALDEKPENHYLRRQLNLLNKASITTIHSFCLEVVRSNFQSLDLDPDFRVSDETEATLLKIEVLNDLFAEIYEREDPDSDFFELLECYAENWNDQALQNLILDLYNFVRSIPRSENWLREKTKNFAVGINNFDFSFTPWGKALLKSIEIELAGAQNMLEKALDLLKTASGLERYVPVFEEERSRIKDLNKLLKSKPLWDEVYSELKHFEFARLPRAGKEADKICQERVKKIRDKVKEIVSKIKNDLVCADSQEIALDFQKLYPLMRCLTDLVLEFGKRYAQKKKEKALVDFNDLEHLCLEILTVQDTGEGKNPADYIPSPIALSYREHFVEILVDEYQDSNLVQEIIIRMISGSEPPKVNVFMVGDIKQSIYRFRQARPELFLEKYSTYSDEEQAPARKIVLSKNFRSRSEVIQTVNFIFRQIMSSSVGELDYTEEEALYPGALFPEPEGKGQLAGGETELHLIHRAANREGTEKASQDAGTEGGVQEEELAEENRGAMPAELLDNIQLEARLTAQIIQELMAPDQEGNRKLIFDKNRQVYRQIEYRDIVILMRATKNWAEVFVEEFTAQGIPAFADTGTGFFKSVEVQVILSLLQIIDNPLQDIPLLAVLRSPIFAFTTEELAEIRLLKPDAYFYEALQESENPKVLSFLKKLERWREESLYLSTDQLLWKIYSETGYYGIVGALPAGEQKQANLRILFERAGLYEKTTFKGLFNFINFIERLRESQGDMGSAKILGENDNVVRLMSVHKSKGLEFPVVILVGLGRKFNVRDLYKKILFHHELGVGPELIDHKRRLSYPSLAKLAIREKIRIESLSEEMRILYVALTRAREKLILIGSLDDVYREAEKWREVSEGRKEKKVSPSDVLQGGKYLDWLGPALIGHKNWENISRVWTRDEISFAVPAENRDGGLSLSRTAEDSPPDKGESWLREEIAARLDWRYPYAELSGIPAKISVTELKRRFKTDDLDPGTSPGLPLLADTNLKLKRPLFLEGKKGLTAAEKGTVMHFVMQHLDFKEYYSNREGLEKQIENMVAKGLLTEQQAACIELHKIHSFMASDLAKRMVSSKNIKREVPFNLELPCREIYPELRGENLDSETVLLQGIIDCYFEEEDGLVLLDYKTDYLTPARLEKLREDYRVQIDYYGRALETLTAKRVKEKYIYFFSSGQILKY